MVVMTREENGFSGTCETCGAAVFVREIIGGTFCRHPLIGDCNECLALMSRGEADESSPFIVICDDNDCLRCKAMRVSIEQSKLLEKYEYEFEEQLASERR